MNENVKICDKVIAENNLNEIKGDYNIEKYKKSCFQIQNEKKVYIWGSGIYAEKFISLYSEDIDIEAILDNNKSKWGEELGSLLICPPCIIKNLDADSIKVIICVKECSSIVQQLHLMGIVDIGIYDPAATYSGNTVLIGRRHQEIQYARKPKVGYIAGIFDMLNILHVNILKYAKSKCDYLIVAVYSDEYVKSKYGIKLKMLQDSRCESVLACKYADEVVSEIDNYSNLVDIYDKYHFDIMFCDDVYKDELWWKEQQQYLQQKGSDIVFFPYLTNECCANISNLFEGIIL